MSDHKGTVICLTTLPQGLLSRRELLNHFSKFGSVSQVSLDKTLGNAFISFSNNEEAANAKLNGKIWNNIILNILWEKKSNLDPREKEFSDDSYASSEKMVEGCLWSDDDKESFGIDEDEIGREFKKKRQKSYNDLISSHLNIPQSKVVSETGHRRTKPKHSPIHHDLKRESGKDTLATDSVVDVRDKIRFRRSMKQSLSKPETSNPIAAESILKRKMKDTENIKTELKILDTSQKSGESILKKRIKENHTKQDNFSEKKNHNVIKCSEENLKKQITKSKSSIKILSKLGVKNRVGKKKLVNPELPKSVIEGDKIQFKNISASDLKDKYNLLDERDKLLRKLEVKDSNVKTAVAMKGTCPDMCPEKERIMRSFQRLVSVYEMESGSNEMVEHLAIKEYSRSSADKEEPLPHELRPGPILRMTMNYLIRNIMNRIEDPNENIAEWYNFCWDRLRGIRKDIIQQQLCTLEAVEIVEQCARFHICCYDYLWGNDVSIFDDKINTENLMNCLQSLMYMYEDLSNEGISCPNEGEFNAYMILLKLNSGDLLWDYQRFSPQTLVDPFVNNALDLHKTFSMKMYTKFFKIVNQSTYLFACLCHRYFPKIRSIALEQIVKAYSILSKPLTIPVQSLAIVLKIDNIEDLFCFVESHGLEFIGDDKFDRTGFFVPESVINIKSFPNMIRMKRLSVGQAVVGERNKIPSYYMHKVHSSFNDEGKLKEDALDASDQALKVHKFSQDVLFQSEEKAKLDVKMSISQIPQVTQSTNLFIDPICKESHETLPFTFILPQDKNIPKRNLSKEVLFSSKLSSGDVFKTSDNSFVEQDVLQIPKEDLPQNLFDTSQNNQYNDIQTVEIDAVKVEEIYQDVKKYYEHNEESKDKQKIHFGSDNKSLFSQHSNVGSTFTFTLNDARTTNQLSKTNQNILPPVSSNENNVKFKHDFKNIPETDSVMPSVESVSNNFKNNLEANKENLAVQHRKQEEALRLLIEKSEMEKRKSELEAKRKKEEQKMLAKLKKNLSKRLKAINARKYAKIWKEKVEEIKKFKKSNVPMLVHLSIEDHLRLWGSSSNSEKTIGIMERLHHRKSTTNIINKVLKSGLPNSMTYCGNVISEQLVKSVETKSVRNVNLHPIFWKMVVSIPESINEETITLSKLLELWCRKTFYKRNVELGSVQCTTTSSNISVYTCVHLVKNYNCHKQCNGMSSLMFIIVNNWETPSQTVDRLRLLLSPQNLKYPCFVSVLKIGGATLEPIIEKSLIKSKQNNIITDWNFTEWCNCNNISQSLNLMAQNISYISEIRSASIDFVLKETVEQFFSSLLGARYLSYGLKNAAILPNNIIRLYNICVGKLENILLSSELERYAHFPLEFQPFVSKLDIPSGIEQFVGCEYNNTYKMNISKLIRSLNLPEFSSWPPKTANRLVKVLKSYCGQVKDVTLLPQIIRHINISDDEELTKCLSSVSWIQIVELWAKQVVNYELNNHNERSGKKTFVLYNKHDLTELVSDQWWLKTSIVINSECKDN